ncbi:MAG: hypothetical protein ACOYJX_04630 [Acutalibacteraceae bacterium]|jgi:hypothetical protein
MADTYISFYLRNNRIHIFVDALRGIGSPKYVCFLIADDGKNLILSTYKKKDFHSHRVPQDVYHGKRSLELASMRLCQILTAEFGWDSSKSYRIPGRLVEDKKIVVFDLSRAAKIGE